MIVDSGTYDKLGGSTGFSGNSSTRLFVSRGRNLWVKQLTPMTYLWPILWSLLLIGSLAQPGHISIWWLLAAIINFMWFMVVHADHKAFNV